MQRGLPTAANLTRTDGHRLFRVVFYAVENQPVTDFAAEMSTFYLSSCGLLGNTGRGPPVVFVGMHKKTQTHLAPKVRDSLIRREIIAFRKKKL